MHDYEGWQSLNSKGASLKEDYMRTSSSACDVDVPKGTLVEVSQIQRFFTIKNQFGFF